MAKYQELKAAINVNVRKNGNEEITGDILNRVLNRMVDSLGGGYQFVGQATTQTDPGTPDNNVYYITTTAGTYTNFGGLVVNDGELALLTYNGNWQKITVQLSPGGGSGTAAEGAKMYPIYIPSLLMVEELSDTQKEANVAVYQSVINKEDAVYYLHQTIEGYDMDVRIVCTGISAAFGMVTLQAYVYGISTITQFAITINEDGTITDTSGDIPIGGGSQPGGKGVHIYRIYLNPETDEQIEANINVYNLAISGNDILIYYVRDDGLFSDIAKPIYIDGLDYILFIMYEYVFGTQNGKPYSVRITCLTGGVFLDGSVSFIEDTYKLPTTTYMEDFVVEKTEDIERKVRYVKLTYTSSYEATKLQPNYYYVFDGYIFRIDLDTNVDNTICNEYFMKIICNGGTPDITLPNGLIWANDTAPVFTAGKTYMISIIDNLAVFAEFTTQS